VLQWEKDSVEEAGLVKIDILGNRSLAVIRDALDLVEKNYGRRIDYASWNPINDPKTVEIFYRGNTFGVFYFESPATRQVLTKVASGITLEEYLKMDHYHLNVVVTSIIRPASNQSIRTWVSRLHGKPWDVPHLLLMPVLEETLGVMVFQEQLSQAAIHMAGFDAAEADTLRKVVTKKHKEKKLRDFHARFIKGAGERGVSMKVIEDVWQMMMGFDGYSFCKPHSASYTLVAYKSAYLRAHYPAEFMASVISNHGGYYSTFSYISEARRMGLTVLPPDINRSEIKYTGNDRDIRIGLMQLKELSQEAREAIIHERAKNGPFISFDSFLKRTRSHIHLQDVRVLIKAGCFDTIARGLNRPTLMWQALRFFGQHDAPAQTSLFEEDTGGHKARPYEAYPQSQGVVADPPSDARHWRTVKINTHDTNTPMQNPGGDKPRPYEMRPPTQGARRDEVGAGFIPARKDHLHSMALKQTPYPKHVMLKHESETLGFLLSIHPLDLYRRILKGRNYVRARDLHRHVGKQVTTIGWLITGKTVLTKGGETMKFLSFEDTTGAYETVLFPKVYNRYCHMLNATRPYLLKGRVEEDFGSININISWLGFLDRYKSKSYST
jgi:error-prone DNA polymerase